ncbi:MAG TPA: lysophospholipid acyltransferase family protein [Nakamurella sp.]
MASTEVPGGRQPHPAAQRPAGRRPASGEPAALEGRAAPGSAMAASPVPVSGGSFPAVPAETGWRRGLAGSLAFVRRRMTGDYTVDEFGYDPDFTDTVLLPPLKLLYDKWFRIETVGMENIPDTGGALLVANHSGTVAIDALMTAVAVREHHPRRRPLRMLGADLVFQTPFLGPITRKAGNTLACNPDAERLLSSGELVSVFPEGFKGVGKPYSQRYKLQRFGRGGFVTAALRTGMPIIPVSIVGAEEIYPLIGNIKPLARALGFPYFPVTPTFPLLGPLGVIPLPSKWIIEFGEPIPTDIYPENASDDPMVVFNLTDRVRETIQQTLYRLLLRRGHPFLG